MAKQDYIPKPDPELVAWHDNFNTQVAALAATFGLVAADTAAVAPTPSSLLDLTHKDPLLKGRDAREQHGGERARGVDGAAVQGDGGEVRDQDGDADGKGLVVVGGGW